MDQQTHIAELILPPESQHILLTLKPSICDNAAELVMRALRAQPEFRRSLARVLKIY